MPEWNSLSEIIKQQKRPALFSAGEPLFWDDPYISAQMLRAHLDPTTDLASRRPETIAASVDWIINTAGLEQGDAVLDLGCGPGLYAARLAQRGQKVTGVDISRRSIDYARKFAAEYGLAATYRCQNYLDLADENQYDAALLIFGDYCTFSPQQRQQILQNVRRALKPVGWFILDVTTRVHRERHGIKNGWYASEGGFWQPGPHLVLEQGFEYPEEGVFLDQYIVVDEAGEIRVYQNWFQDFDPETIRKELTMGGFEVRSLWGDLTGTPLTVSSEWIGIAAQNRGSPPNPVRGNG